MTHPERRFFTVAGIGIAVFVGWLILEAIGLLK